MGKIRDSVDARALRFAIGFPLMLAAGFVVCALLVRRELPEDLQGAIFVEAPIEEGIFVIRAFVPDDSWKPVVSQFLEQSSCELQDY